MDIKITKDMIDDFKKHLAWRWLEEWILAKQYDIKGKLLKAKTYEDVIRLQEQHETYTSILKKVNNLSEKDLN